VYVLLGPALLVMAVAIVLRVVVFRNRRDWARPLRIVWLVALLVAIVAFLDGIRYACCY
jgi:multisubunit Na+/H+ antiporter MnhB subunit